MILNELEQLSNLRNEITLYIRRLSELENMQTDFMGDTVKDYSTGRGHVITIQGYVTVESKQTKMITEIINRRVERLAGVIASVEAFIDTVDNSNVRQIIELRFVRGWNWKKVATTVYGSPQEDKARKCVTRYFEKIKAESVQSE